MVFSVGKLLGYMLLFTMTISESEGRVLIINYCYIDRTSSGNIQINMRVSSLLYVKIWTRLMNLKQGKIWWRILDKTRNHFIDCSIKSNNLTTLSPPSQSTP